MNKELTPLEALERIKDIIREDAEDIDNPRLLVDELSIIETELKENWQLKDEVQALKEINQEEHKALEIIKEKKVNVLELSVCANYETYMSFFKQWNWNGEYDDFIITQEEYNLLKEVLL